MTTPASSRAPRRETTRIAVLHAGIAAALGAGARSARRSLIGAAIAALGLAALAAPAALANFTPEAGTYVDHSTSHGHRVSFHYAADWGTVHDFTLSSITIFHSATVHHTTEGWRFYHYDSHYIVHGHWLNHWTVVGSICNLHIDPTGCRTSGSQSFEAVFPHAKPLEGPWMGTTDSGANDVTFTVGPSLTGSGNLVIFDLNIHPPEWTYSNFYSSRNGPLETNSDGAWHFYRDGNYDLVSATWTDPVHMHGHVCDKGAYGCKPAYTFTFTAHAVGYTPGGAR